MNRRETRSIWTCDGCGSEQVLTDAGLDAKPIGWHQIVTGRLDEALGNKPAKHLCGPCWGKIDGLVNKKP